MYRRLIFFLFASASLSASDICEKTQADEVVVDLRNPVYKNGILYTSQGGVVKNKNLRIQAQTIQYIRKNENGKAVHLIEAEGQLMIQYKGRVYIGSELIYDLITSSGTIYDGKTFSSMCYVGGDEIHLNSDGSYTVDNAFITTCENRDSSWDLHADRVNVMKQDMLQAEKLRLRLFKIPTLWLPSFKINLRKFDDSVFRYYVNWDKGQGPRVGARYQLYSWQEFAFYGRLEYRWRTGWSGAFETEYFPEPKRITFVTRSFLGSDRLETAPDKMRRYRLQGAYHAVSESGQTQTTLTWDKYSDVRMPSDFQSEDFEVSTAKKTIFYVYHQEPPYIASFKIRPRANTFESIKQDLPTVFATTRPLEIGSSGIITMSYLRASYLDFDYSDKLAQSLPGFQTFRCELSENLYRAFHLGPVTFTPHIGGLALLYGTSQTHEGKKLGLLSYGAKANLQGTRSFKTYKHIAEPYLEYKALTRPTVAPDDHYIFTIQDGYQKIQQIEIGFRNLLFTKDKLSAAPFFTGDLYANAFFSDATIPQVVPRIYLRLGWNLPSVFISSHNCWNFRHQILDFAKARCKWTINENIALTLEARYRSKYDWRKADHENFILDVTRSETELLLSPLSDRRITFLANLFIRLSPFWECQIQSHHGFYRFTEDPYNEVKVDLFTWINSTWKVRLSYSHTDKDDRVSAGISLIKK